HPADDETAKCPESLCPIEALPRLGRRVPPPRRTLLLRLRSYGLMRQSHLALPYFSICLDRGVFAGCYQPLLPMGPSRRYLCESFLGCLVPYHGGLMECVYLFLPPWHRPSPTEEMGRLTRFTRKHDFPRSVFRGCRHFFMFRPPSLLASQIVPTAARYSRRATETFTSEQNMLRYLTCIGYASRP